MAMEDVKQLVRELLEEVKSLETKLDEVVRPLEETSSAIPMASGSLEDVIRFTEESVHQIISLINELIGELEKVQEDVDFLLSLNPVSSIRSRLESIKERSRRLSELLLQIITLMSFQDLASQQIKRVIEVLENLKKTILRIIVSSIEAATLPSEQKEKIVGKATEMLTGDRIFQEDVDKLLEELGL
ncbi:protein phosphatase CheZ [Hydrogenobacter sp. T-2]|uniref:protein phosphatase CheZ n=1 Tax=Pampinifervens diazotrophicum TaxID=1632018 RepID=UPI002B25673C|nr:protein phosphatase CheZ [Hydrogenobacter sp. T-2]WPM31641.1 protein phosphatase CheZ [Hydrogenobacter sp. T-2]